jgi:ferredoxin
MWVTQGNEHMTTLDRKNLQKLIDSAKAAGYRFVAPVRDGTVTRFKETGKAEDVVLDEILPSKSVKEFFLAEYEPILRYRFNDGSKVDIEPVEPSEFAKPVFIFGCRPCDAAAPPIIQGVMTWDYNDNFFLERVKANVVASIACVEADEACFCTSVNVQPDGGDGADILLKPTSSETGALQEYIVEAVTDKGKEFIGKTHGWGDGDVKPSAAIDELKSKLKPRFDPEQIRKWLHDNFSSTFWSTASLQCIGCGTCTYLCPTCHCFDIVDEGDVEGGKRVKNWDACQFKEFTLHTSGHNPREFQSERYRQRIMHKFRYYPDKFGRILCTGCGRCQRACPVDMAMVSVVERIRDLA